eukprot:evm.model.scf_63.3 EVM.evm.TU.scf_63.3   scf_63:12904-13406(-)
MDVALPEEVSRQTEAFAEKLDWLRRELQPFLDVGPKELEEELGPLERAQWYAAVSRASVALYQLHCKSRGLGTDGAREAEIEKVRRPPRASGALS